MISIKDIARITGVSASTVSRVVNGKKYIKAEIRERVLAAVRETGYVPSRAARSMVLKRTFTVGIVIPHAFNMFQRQLFAIIEHQLEAKGFHTLFLFAKWEEESELECLRRLKSENLDGVIMMHEVSHPAFYEYLAQTTVPVVLCTFERADLNCPSVHVDEEAAAHEATEYLISLGHERIGFIAGSHFSFSRQRAQGYRSALDAAGIAYDQDLVSVAGGFGTEYGKVGMTELLAKGEGLTALFASTDELAIGAMRALYERDLAVPRDVSIVGFDDIDVSAYLSPGLTTIAQPIAEIGRATAESISALVSGQAPPSRMIFGHRLVVRESTRRRD
jgi:LacI family transcriptional regulator